MSASERDVAPYRLVLEVELWVWTDAAAIDIARQLVEVLAGAATRTGGATGIQHGFVGLQLERNGRGVPRA